MSLRAVGEGHISSIEFRTGVIDAASNVSFDPLGPVLVTGEPDAAGALRQGPVRRQADRARTPGNDLAWSVLDRLPERFTLAELEQSLETLERDGPPHAISFETAKIMRVLAASSYVTSFPADSSLSERIMFPAGPHETHGMEDARFVRFTDDDGSATYYATYTAFDGFEIVPQLIQTDDFVTFRIATLNGAAAQNKGMALFPRRIRGKYVMLSRLDRENLHLATSDGRRSLDRRIRACIARSGPGSSCRSATAARPSRRRQAGWSSPTASVRCGGTRIGALLLDLDDPHRVIGQLREPLLAPEATSAKGTCPTWSTRAARWSTAKTWCFLTGCPTPPSASRSFRSPASPRSCGVHRRLDVPDTTAPRPRKT